VSDFRTDSGPTSPCSSAKLQVDVYQGDSHVANGTVAVNTLGSLLPLNISGLKPQQSAYGLSCKATLGSQTFATNASLLYLPPNPFGGNTVKVDRRSGALLVRNETAGEKSWEKIIPFGFYDVRALMFFGHLWEVCGANLGLQSYNSTSDPSIYGPDYGTDVSRMPDRSL
jgi:hypothetical protein